MRKDEENGAKRKSGKSQDAAGRTFPRLKLTQSSEVVSCPDSQNTLSDPVILPVPEKTA